MMVPGGLKRVGMSRFLQYTLMGLGLIIGYVLLEKLPLLLVVGTACSICYKKFTCKE